MISTTVLQIYVNWRRSLRP